ncbi:MAG TPA: hypothetical protein VH370_23135 [Humisphaera sp.]|nr:hypothetical protein [Humisphaera sp.]
MHLHWLLLGFAVAVLIGAVLAVASAYGRWLDRQSPVGVWIARTAAGRITLQFEGGPREGLYKQLTESGDASPSREFGHWTVERETLRMLILATDVKRHPRFGADTPYRLTYLSILIKPMPRIQIDGPDRTKLVFRRAKPGSTLDFGPVPNIGRRPENQPT